MSYQDQLKDKISAFIPEDRKDELEQAIGPIFDSMSQTFSQYDKDIKDLKKAVKAAEVAAAKDGSLIDPKVYDKLQSDYDTMELDLQKAQAELKKYETQFGEVSKKLTKSELTAKQLSDKLSRESSLLDSHLLSGAIQKEMNNLPLAEGAAEEIFDILSKNVRVVADEEGNRRVVALVKDAATGTEIERTVSEHVKNWANTSPVAKRLLIATRTTGTGAYGTVLRGGEKKSFDKMSIKERTELYRDNRPLYDQLKAAFDEGRAI